MARMLTRSCPDPRLRARLSFCIAGQKLETVIGAVPKSTLTSTIDKYL